MEPSLILTYILIVLSLIIGPLIIVLLYKAIQILSKVEEVISYIDHIRELVEMWEQLPLELLKKFMSFWSK